MLQPNADFQAGCGWLYGDNAQIPALSYPYSVLCKYYHYCLVKDLHIMDQSFEKSGRQGRAVHFLIPVFRFEF